MMILFIIATAIVVILMCREAILHKGDFFEKAIMASSNGDIFRNELATHGDLADNPFGDKDLVGVDPSVDGSLPGDPLYEED